MPYTPVYINFCLRVEDVGSQQWAVLTRKDVPLQAVPLPGHLLKFREIDSELAVVKVVFMVSKPDVVVTLETVETPDLEKLVAGLTDPEAGWKEIERSI